MNQNRFLILTMLFISATIVISCSRPEITPDKKIEAQFSSNILIMNSPAKAAGNVWDASDAIGIYMYAEATLDVVEDIKNIKYITDDGGTVGSFKPTGTRIYFPDNGDKVRFMAYYPQIDGIQVNDIYPVNVADQSEQEVIDLLYSFNTSAKYDKKSPDRKVSLVFDHQLTKIQVNVKAGEGLSNSDLQDIVVSFSGFNTTADFNLTNGSLNNPEAPEDIDMLKITAKEGYTASFEAIVLPSTEIPTASIVFDLKNGNPGAGIESDLFTWDFNNTLNKSTRYIYNVTINRSGIVVEATINDWIPTDEEDIDAK